jgi:hypothetical protein
MTLRIPREWRELEYSGAVTIFHLNAERTVGL